MKFIKYKNFLKNKAIISFFYRLLIVVFVVSGLIVNFVTEDTAPRDILVMYTTMSNILVGVFFLYLIILTALNLITKQSLNENSEVLIFCKSCVTYAITVTFLIFLFGITPATILSGDSEWLSTYWNIVLHYIVPPMVILDWLLFDKKKIMKKWYPLAFVSVPFSYLIFALVRAEIGGILREGTPNQSRYPYPFIDIDLLGVGVTVAIVLGITLICIGLGYLMYRINHIDRKKGV